MRITVSIAAAASLLALAAFGAAAAAGSTGADLRVVGPSGQLDDITQYSDTTSMPTSPRADCFGPGSGGSGQAVTVQGANALGIVVEAAKSRNQLNPLLLTDTLCRRASDSVSAASAASPPPGAPSGTRRSITLGCRSAAPVPHPCRRQVLWYLAPNFPPPPELVLNVPVRQPVGAPFPVQVLAYDDTGAATPAAGAVISGSGAPVTTDASGNALVGVSGTGSRQIQATLGADIPSAVTQICSFDTATECPAARGRVIVGSDTTDEITGTAGNDQIKPRAGNDMVRALGGRRSHRRSRWRQGPRQLRRRHRQRQGRQARQARQELRAAQPRRQEAQARQAQGEGQEEVRSLRIPAAALALSPAAAAGCGLGPGKDQGDVTHRHPRLRRQGPAPEDRFDSRVRHGLSGPGSERRRDHALRRRLRPVDRRARGSQSGGRSSDWFFYVNGIESPIGSAQFDLSGGDRIWWDYRDWTAAMRVPAVVGSWPEPFVHGSRASATRPRSPARERQPRATRSRRR